jgi:protein involved in polysaccharide export with SLBB domain
LPAPTPTEFQDFVATSIGRVLPIYGHSLFDQVPSTFAPIDRVPVTADYVVGPGDELLVRAWGQIDLDARIVVDRGGEIYLPKVGKLSVAGLRYEQLSDYLKTSIGRVFRNFDLTVSLGRLRSIQVFVVGQARRPGTYTVSSLSTLINALFASGGPAPSGSMRHIQLRRNNVAVTEFDFYDLLLGGDKSKDARLLPGDVIYIPPVGASVAVAGSVNVPSVYELRQSTNLRQAIEMAGGLATTADGQKVVVERIENRITRKVEEFTLDEKGWGRELKDGDVVRVLSLSPRFENAVVLRGNVARPGRYQWHSGMRIRDLIPNQDALVTRAFWRENNVISAVSEIRDNSREALQREMLRKLQAPVMQEQKVFSPQPERAGSPTGYSKQGGSLEEGKKEYRSSSQIETDESGSASYPRVSAKAATAKTTEQYRNEIARSTPEINWDYALIQRLNQQDLTTHLVPFNLGRVIIDRDESENLPLEPGDVITVFSQADLAVPVAKQSKFVRLEGEIRAAGVYRAEPGETLRHLVERAGGLSSSAYLYGAEFTRESVREEQQKGLDELVQNLDQEMARNSSAGTATSEEAAQKRIELEAQRQMIEKLREVKATGRVVLELKPDAGIAAIPDITLEDGDRFFVPYRASSVAVVGAVYNKNSFLYRRDKRVGDYLKQAGGPTRNADRARIFVVRADGSVFSKQSTAGLWTGHSFEALRLMPGDAVVVPERLSQGSKLRAMRDWTQMFSQFALGAAALSVIRQ